MFLLTLGVVGMIAGTITSVKDIIEFFSNPPEGGNFPKCSDYNATSILGWGIWVTFTWKIQLHVPNRYLKMIRYLQLKIGM